jgi:hypothetical protein
MEFNVNVPRRTVLIGGAAIGMSIAGGPGVAAAAPTGERLRLDYRPSQPTGWQPTYHGPGAPVVGATIGGHRTSAAFSFNGVDYRISLLSFDGAQDPVYERYPADPTVAFRQTLASAFGTHYAFEYRGSPERFSVESYSVFADVGNDADVPTLRYGADIYVVHRGQYDQALRWIQVLNRQGSPKPGSEVDSSNRANPFYIIGGPTSIYGQDIVNFVDTPQNGFVGGAADGGDSGTLSDVFVAEAFLVRQSEARDSAGRPVVHILAGLKYGWYVAAH